MIEWEPFKEKHCLGHSELGKIWVRTNRDNKVTGLYFMWSDGVNKIVPKTEEEETLAGIKILAEIMIETKKKEKLLTKSVLKTK
jgi:hypothetical protein